MTDGRGLLTLGGLFSLGGAVLHIGCIVLGADWFRFFGAPEPLVQAYEAGDMTLVWMTIGITLILALLAAYAFSGAGRIRRLPLLRTGLVTISAIYLVRGLFLFPALYLAPYPRSGFDIGSSAVVLLFGLTYAVGTWKAWPALAPSKRSAA